MNENTVSFKLTVTQVVKLLGYLREQHDADLWRLRNLDVPEDGSDIDEYAVKGAESELRRRERVAELIAMVTGESEYDEYADSVIAYRAAYEAQLAEQRANSLTAVES